MSSTSIDFLPRSTKSPLNTYGLSIEGMPFCEPNSMVTGTQRAGWFGDDFGLVKEVGLDLVIQAAQCAFL